MYEQKAETAIVQAEELFQMAQEELARPEEDVVPYSVCRNAFKSVNKYLSGYLLKNGIDIHASMSLDVLLKHCMELNPRFKELNLDPLYSSSQPEDVWMDMDTANEFIHLASRTRELVDQT